MFPIIFWRKIILLYGGCTNKFEAWTSESQFGEEFACSSPAHRATRVTTRQWKNAGACCQIINHTHAVASKNASLSFTLGGAGVIVFFFTGANSIINARPPIRSRWPQQRVSPNQICDAEQNAKISSAAHWRNLILIRVCAAEWAAVVKHYALFGAGVLLRNCASRKT